MSLNGFKLTKSFFFFSFLTCLFSFQDANASVEFSSLLAGEKSTNGNKIKWSTVSEKNSDFFLIEKSYDGILFERVAIIQGAGDSDVKRNYDYTDSLEKSIRIFYRLLPVDKEGKGSYTHSIVLSEKGENAKFFMDYVSSSVTQRIFQAALESKVEQMLNYRVMTQMGEIRLEGQAPMSKGTNFVSIDLEDLAVGTYQLSLQIQNDIEVIALRKMDNSETPTAVLEIEKRN